MTDNFPWNSHKDTTTEPSVVVDHVTVRYMTPTNSKKAHAEANIARRVVGKLLGRNVRVPIYPVRDVSFIAYDGESIGLLGENGAGKSTLLRVIGGFERPLDGQVYATSQPAHLGVNAALLIRLDAYKNAEIGCLAMGMSPEETKEAVPKIIEYAGLGNAAYRAVHTYSSGMRARLRFAISAAVHPRILLVDEALGTGDATFQKKSRNTIDKILSDAGTIFMVNHNVDAIKTMCNRALWIHKGHLIADDSPKQVAKDYAQWTGLVSSGKTQKANDFLLDMAKAFTPIDLQTDLNKPQHLPRHFIS